MKMGRMKMPNRKINKIGDYIIGKSIGKGTFGKVKKGVHAKTNEKVTIKYIIYRLLLKY